MMRFVSRNPWLTVAIVLVLACVACGPATVGHWLGATGREALIGAFRFIVSLVRGAF